MINIFFWITSLFTSAPRSEKPIKVYQDSECGMSVGQLKELKGSPDSTIECYDVYKNLRYGDTYYFFKEGAYMGELPVASYISKCVDNTMVSDFKDACATPR